VVVCGFAGVALLWLLDPDNVDLVGRFRSFAERLLNP
jgi:hypothetical protein